ncbi:MAG: hypothetical protein K940chlam9_01790 [Chlamydiae bacterium]|nr:hypothetical protein [Chlamydiota bacterium]
MSSALGAIRLRLCSARIYPMTENFENKSLVRFFSTNSDSDPQTLSNKKILPGIPEKVKNDKLKSGYFVPRQTDPGYENWEEKVLKGIKDLDAYNKMLETLNKDFKS